MHPVRQRDVTRPRIAVLCASLLMQLSVWVQFARYPWSDFRSQWPTQFAILMVLSAATSMLLLFAGSARAKSWLLSTRLALAVLMLIPLGHNLGIEAVLLSTVVIEAFGHASILGGTIASLATVVTTVSLARSFSVWGVELPPADATHWIAVTGLLLACGIIGGTMRVGLNLYATRAEVQRRLDQGIAELSAMNIALQEQAVYSQERATHDERMRLTRDVHDTVGYTMTNLIMMMEAAHSLVGDSDGELKEIVDEARSEAKGGLVEMKRALASLAPSSLAYSGLVTTILRLTTVVRTAARVPVFVYPGDAPRSLGLAADVVVFRFVQECLTNSLKHGKPQSISIFLRCDGDELCVTAVDDGVGTADLSGGSGLVGMRARIERVGGRLEITTRPRQGFRASAWVPLKGKVVCETDTSHAGRRPDTFRQVSQYRDQDAG